MAKRVLPPELREAAMTVVGPYSEVITLTREQRQQYLARIATGASMHRAASEIGVPYLAVGRELIADETFAAELDAARALRNMALEEIAIEQSTVGIDEVLTHQGRISYKTLDEPGGDLIGDGYGEMMYHGELVPVTVKKLITSNPTLLALLKANNPEKFRERSEVVHRDGPDADVPAAKITSTDDRAKIIAFLEKRARARAAAAADNNEDLI